MIQSQIIKQLLDPYDDSQTECDGMTRICHTVLTNHGIPHHSMFGVLTLQNQEIEPHFWIDLVKNNKVKLLLKLYRHVLIKTGELTDGLMGSLMSGKTA